MKIKVNVWFLTDDNEILPIEVFYQIDDDTNNISDRILDLILEDPIFAEKEGLTIQIVE